MYRNVLPPGHLPTMQVYCPIGGIYHWFVNRFLVLIVLRDHLGSLGTLTHLLLVWFAEYPLLLSCIPALLGCLFSSLPQWGVSTLQSGLLPCWSLHPCVHPYSSCWYMAILLLLGKFTFPGSWSVPSLTCGEKLRMIHSQLFILAAAAHVLINSSWVSISNVHMPDQDVLFLQEVVWPFTSCWWHAGPRLQSGH